MRSNAVKGWRVSPAAYIAGAPRRLWRRATLFALCCHARRLPPCHRRLFAASGAGGGAGSELPTMLIFTPYYRRFRLAARRARRHRGQPQRRQVARPVRSARLCGRGLRRARHRRQLRHARQLPLAGRARGLCRDRRLGRAAAVVGWIDWRHRHLLRRRGRGFPGEHRPSGRESHRSAVCRLGHLFGPLLPRRPPAQPLGRDLRRADAGARPRPPRSVAKVCLLQGSEPGRPAARRR